MTEQGTAIEHKTMNTVVHAAVRRDLDRFDRALAAFPADSQPRADQLKRAWDNFEEEIHYHHTYEETLFWPALQEIGIDLSLVEDLDGEHDAMREALESASAAMTSFHQRPTWEERHAPRQGRVAPPGPCASGLRRHHRRGASLPPRHRLGLDLSRWGSGSVTSPLGGRTLRLRRPEEVTMWAQLIKVQLKDGSDLAEVAEVLKAAEQPGSGLLRELFMHDQTDPHSAYILAVFESEEKAREREQDPRRAEGQVAIQELMGMVLAAPPEFIDMAVTADWVP